MKVKKMRETEQKVGETDERRRAVWQEGQGLQQGAGDGWCCCLQSPLIETQGGGVVGGGDGAAVRGRWRGRV